ncbi:MAG: TolC family protein [Gammaproteobacteria bacterium]|nr:TolC family protein [Gammaproteobacteria bacterium]
MKCNAIYPSSSASLRRRDDGFSNNFKYPADIAGAYPGFVISLFFMFTSLVLLPASVQATGLTLEQAEQIALQYDTVLKAQKEQLLSIEHETVAAGAWEDPNVRIGIMDVPTDSFDINAEPMTQLEIGYQQMFPRGNASGVMTQKKRAQQTQQQSGIKLREREVRMTARKAWLDLYVQQQTEQILLASRLLFSQQLDVSESLYAAGRSNQQDVLQADLELSLVDDRLQQVLATKQEKLAQLVQVIGAEAAQTPIEANAEIYGVLTDAKILHEQLDHHPLVQQQQAAIAMQTEEVSLAQQKFKPQWGFDLSYNRSDGTSIGSEEASTMTFMLMFDLPLITGNAQDRELAASKQMLQAERYMSQDVKRQLISQLDQALARWQQLTRRLELYDQRVLNQAQQNARVALKGYQSGVVTFDALTRARSAELDAQMQRLDLYVEKAMVYAQIMYLTVD